MFDIPESRVYNCFVKSKIGDFMEEERNCFNCGYYNRHYIKLNNGRFHSTAYGHCGCGEMNLRISQRIVDKMLQCDKWMPGEVSVQKRGKRILEIITDMELHLRDIAMFLADDSDLRQKIKNLSE